MSNRWKVIVAMGVMVVSVLVVNLLFFYNLKLERSNGDVLPTYRNVNNGGDQVVYFSLIRQAAEGKNVLLNLYTSEQQIGLISPLWWLMGKVVGVLKLSIPITYYLATMFSALGLLLFVWFLTKTLYEKYWQRLLVIPLLTFGGGLGVFYINRILFPAGGKALTEEALFSQIISADLWYGEGFGYLSLRHSPLFILSQLALAVFFWWVAEKIDMAGWWQAVLTGVSTFLLSIIHPYDAIPLAAFIIVYGLIYWRKREQWLNWLKVVPMGVGALMAAGYFYYLRYLDPSFFGWSVQNVTRSPYPLSFFAGYFWLLIPAIYGCVLAFRGINKRWQWLAIWLILAAFLIFLPFQTQRRFGSGVYIPIALLAWYGWINFWRGKNIFIVSGITAVYFLFTFSTFILITSLNFGVIKTNAQMSTITKQELEALSYYKQISNDSDVLLSSYSVGNLIPAYISRKVYIGHGHQTINWPEKMSFIIWFYSNNGLEKQKHDQLVLRKINYVWVERSDNENKLSSLFSAKYFDEVFSNTKVLIYKVKP